MVDATHLTDFLEDDDAVAGGARGDAALRPLDGEASDAPETLTPPALSDEDAHVPLQPPPSLSASDILFQRPDVLEGFYTAYYEGGAYKAPTQWRDHVGGETPEAYAKYWADRHGKWEGFARTPGEGVDLGRLLQERPDVIASYYTGFYEAGNDRKPEGWIAQVGGASLEDYGKYWYDRHGKWEGYTQSEGGERLSAAQVLQDRPDVLRAFYTEYYENGAFRKPDEWISRMGGKAPEDYAKYWYDQHGKWEGYSQFVAPAHEEPPPIDAVPPEGPEAPSDAEVRPIDGGPIELTGGALEPADIFA